MKICFKSVLLRFGRLYFTRLNLEHSRNFPISQISFNLFRTTFSLQFTYCSLTVRKALSFCRHCRWVRSPCCRNNHMIRLCFGNIRFHHRYRPFLSSYAIILNFNPLVHTWYVYWPTTVLRSHDLMASMRSQLVGHVEDIAREQSSI